MISVRVENTYVCGRESDATTDVADPVAHDEASLENWWEDEAYAATGDGHGPGVGGEDCEGGEREDALYEVTVLAAPGFPELVGQKREWGL